MPQFKVFWKVEPTCFKITFDFEAKVCHRIEGTDIDLQCTIAVKESMVVATCDTSRWDDATLNLVLNYVFDWVSAEIDLFTFASGMVLTVQLDYAEFPDGSIRQLIGTAPELAELATACKLMREGGNFHVDLRELLRTVVQSPTLMVAVRDLTSAVRYGNNTLANCGRAMEGLRKSMWGKEEEEKDKNLAWKLLRETLNVSEAYLKTVTEASCGPRHGSAAYVRGSKRQEILAKSWTVMNRFLLFRLGGSKALAAPEYPSL